MQHVSKNHEYKLRRSRNLRSQKHENINKTKMIIKRILKFQKKKKLKKCIIYCNGYFHKAILTRIDKIRECITFKYEKSTEGIEIKFAKLSSQVICCNDIDLTKYAKGISDESLINDYRRFKNNGQLVENLYSTNAKKKQRIQFKEESLRMFRKTHGNILFLETEYCNTIKLLQEAGIPLKSIWPCNNNKEICDLIKKQYPDINVWNEDIKNIFNQKSNQVCSVWFDMEERLESFGKPPALDSFDGFVMINLSTRAQKATEGAKDVRKTLLKNTFHSNAFVYCGFSGKMNMVCGYAYFRLLN